MNSAIQIGPDDFRRMQLLELEMLVEFDRVCRDNNIAYTIFGGTLLGAVRHKGFIPWDDDADVAMLRDDYERFRLVADQMDSGICFFQDHLNDPEYRWGYGKLRRTGTEYVRVGQEHLKCKNGVFVDVFPMDDVPISVPGQIIQDCFCTVLRKILWSEVGKLNPNTSMPMRKLYSLMSNVDTKTVFDITRRIEKKSDYNSRNRVRVLLFPPTGTLYRRNPMSLRYAMPKEWFKNVIEYDFEGVKLFGTREYDAILTYIYGDYMTIPPESERGQHSPVSSYSF